MQKRHHDSFAYFVELSITSREYFIPYVQQFGAVADKKILEIGCGEGGNLLPFAQAGCAVTGIDISENKIIAGGKYFQHFEQKGEFFSVNFFDFPVSADNKFDIILIHDVIEHIFDKEKFLNRLKNFCKTDCIIFFGFPAWQMPFGGHQQMCKSKIISVFPFIHLLPVRVYSSLLKLVGESQITIEGMIDVKKCATSIELFEKLINNNGFKTIDRTLWFINPHYKQKFNLTPRKLNSIISKIKYIRNFFSTSCFYLLKTGN
ncbi:MAG: methyltransferase domain-containing protein [Prevotellaceae bacterium]|jgi:2-polyprenyl-3-methyl-5-hydroxy-6-metoxy-1,4-benzoquinol methylase|nr:methyltransferase domain-containing protein [Prevotellaceae bacterium]